MSDIGLTAHSAMQRALTQQRPPVMLQRGLLVLAIAASAVAGALVTGPAASSHAVADAGADLARLLRAMAGMKAMAAAGLAAAVLWRLALPASRVRLLAYAVACAAMAAGPGLIWGMAHVRLGAFLLHGGLLATVLLLWRDPAMGARLDEAVTRRRQVIRARK